MKLQPRPRSSRARAQLSNQLLAYSAATAATLGAASTAKAQITLNADYFGGSLPSIAFGTNDHQEFNFTIEGVQFTLYGENYYFQSWTWSDLNTNNKIYYTSFSGKLGIRASGVDFVAPGPIHFGSDAYVRSQSGNSDNAFGGNPGALNFTTAGGGTGTLNFQFFYGAQGAERVTLTDGTYFSAVPEPANVACGLGLVALGFAGIREHRRRRTAAAAKKSAAKA